MRRLPVLLLPLALVLAAGCAAPAGRLARHCEGQGASAQWTEPGLFEALPEAARSAGLEPVAGFGDVGPLPFRHPDLDARHGQYELVNLRWMGPDDVALFMHAAQPGEYEVTVQTAFDDARLPDLLGTFLDHVGLGDAPERPAWERALVHAPRDQWPPRVVILGEPRLDALYERLRDDLAEDARGTGGFELKGLRWHFSFRLPGWRVETGELALYVDAKDQVVVFMRIVPGPDRWASFQRATNETFAGLGLPPPTWQGLRNPSMPNC